MIAFDFGHFFLFSKNIMTETLLFTELVDETNVSFKCAFSFLLHNSLCFSSSYQYAHGLLFWFFEEVIYCSRS